MKAWLLFPPAWLAQVLFGLAISLGGSLLLLSFRPGTQDRTLSVLTVLFFVVAAAFLVVGGLR